MRGRKGFLGFLHRRPMPIAGVLAVALAAVEVFIDWGTWIELSVSIVYTLPLVLAAVARSRRLLWSLALFLVGTTFAVYAVQIGPGVLSLHEHYFVDRVLSAATVLLMAAMLNAWTLALDQLEEQGASLKAQNEQLDLANRELLRYKEEITRKNEELDRRRKEAEEASGRKTRLLASVSHDIRSPLTAINLMAQLIRRTAKDPALSVEIPGLAERLEASAVGLTDLVSDVLDISSFDSGQVELHESEFSVNELLAEEGRRSFPLAEAKTLTLSVEPMVSLLWIRSDRVKLARVLSNLVTNAIKFTKTGTVMLGASLTADRAMRICIRDTGVGIAAENLDRVFDEFAQLPNPEGDPVEGWGLGLAISRRLIELLGGTITVESQPNRGSVFSVRLPPSCVLNRSDNEKTGATREPSMATHSTSPR